MREEMRSFLEEGVRQYVDAKNTVATFEREMGQLLAEAVQRRRQWSPLNDTPRIGRPSHSGGSGGYGYWIWILITGQTKTYKVVLASFAPYRLSSRPPPLSPSTFIGSTYRVLSDFRNLA